MSETQENAGSPQTSRRDFLKAAGIAAGTLAAGSALLTGCAQGSEPSTAQGATGSAAGADGIISTPMVEKWDHETEVLILGFGGAGAAAAIEAHDAGSEVLVIERQTEERHFPNTRMSGGVWHNPVADGDRTARVDYIKAMMSGENCPWKYEGEQEHVSQEMAEMFADRIMENEAWLLELDPDLDPEGMAAGGDASFPMFPSFKEAKYGATVSTRYKDYKNADPKVPIYERPKEQKTSGEALMHAIVITGIKEKRPDINIMWETRASQLVQRDNGEIIGALATTADGQTIAIKAKKAVILSTGGFEYDLPMRRAFQEGPGVTGWGFYGTPYNTGDGIRMAMLVGCGLAKVAKSASRIEAAFPTGIGWEEYGLKMGVNTAVTSTPNSFIVDNFGNRYQDEHIITDSKRPYRYQFYKEAVKYDLLTMNYTRDPSWVIFDQTCFDRSSVVSSGSSVGYDFVDWVDNQDGVDKGWIIKADTLEELAQMINDDPENRHMMEAENLTAAQQRFNGFCAAGEDGDFARTPDTMGPVDAPPFYAMKMYPGGPNTKGGIDANAKRQAMDWDMNPIPRLYTAGEISSVFKFTYQAGGNVTECMVCGRLAGENAAAEQPWE